jgi:hypothetical protein
VGGTFTPVKLVDDLVAPAMPGTSTSVVGTSTLGTILCATQFDAGTATLVLTAADGSTPARRLTSGVPASPTAGVPSWALTASGTALTLGERDAVSGTWALLSFGADAGPPVVLGRGLVAGRPFLAGGAGAVVVYFTDLAAEGSGTLRAGPLDAPTSVLGAGVPPESLRSLDGSRLAFISGSDGGSPGALRLANLQTLTSALLGDRVAPTSARGDGNGGLLFSAGATLWRLPAAFGAAAAPVAGNTTAAVGGEGHLVYSRGGTPYHHDGLYIVPAP